MLSSRKLSLAVRTRCNRIRHLPFFFSFFFAKDVPALFPSWVSLPTYFVGYSWIGISVGKPAISFIKSNWTRVGGFAESNYMLMARFAWQPSFVSQSARAELAFGPLRFHWWPMSVLTRPSPLAGSSSVSSRKLTRYRDHHGNDRPTYPLIPKSHHTCWKIFSFSSTAKGCCINR